METWERLQARLFHLGYLGEELEAVVAGLAYVATAGNREPLISAIHPLCESDERLSALITALEADPLLVDEAVADAGAGRRQAVASSW